MRASLGLFSRSLSELEVLEDILPINGKQDGLEQILRLGKILLKFKNQNWNIFWQIFLEQCFVTFELNIF